MKKLNYNIEINSSPEKVYDNMLGLSDKHTYEQWTVPFSPNSSWEGGWNKGDKIAFVGISKDGIKSGMLARIAENDPGKYVSIEHYGMLEKGVEITEGEAVESWKGAHENYRFEPTVKGTRVTVEVDMVDEYISHMDEAWPKALNELKRISE
ncbi:SRPBCC domain-containing protein [Fluviicola taffensis]|uniref:SRPBCC family protein n=1 Tax=Fluviicola taffensis TaxID=191579 RepID=UPI003137A902